ncbi:MAG: hypothetical protein ABEJ65_11920, partial [bacterium]
NFSCSTFTSHAKAGSDGIFRGVVKGVTVNDSGDSIAESQVEVIVDRRPLTGSDTGAMEIIYQRKN